MNLYLQRPLPDGIGTVTQWFGEHPDWYARFGLAGHNGIDYGAPAGSPILAAHDGVASLADDPAGYGLHVRLLHPRGHQTLYGHMSAVASVNGQEVRAGERIGAVGSTGNSTGPHLHFGLKLARGSNPAYAGWVDPLPFRTLDDAVRGVTMGQVRDVRG